MNLAYPWSALMHAALIIGGILLFSRLLPAKDNYPTKSIISSLIFVIISLWLERARMMLASPVPSLSSLLLETLVQTALLCVGLAFVMNSCEADVWSALYCVIAAYLCQSVTESFALLLGNLSYGFYRTVPLAVALLFLGISCALVYISSYYSLVKPLEEHGLTEIRRRPMLLIVLMTLCISVIFDLVGRNLQSYAVPTLYVYVLRVIQILAGIFLLFMEYELLYSRRLELEVTTIERMRADSAKQYQLSKETIDAINLKFHDIRHQIRHIQDSQLAQGQTQSVVDKELLHDIAREVRIYDASVKTGSETFDVLLTERRLACEREDISLSCICEGEALEFMSPTDLYTLFGNIIDNAIEVVDKIDDPEKRAISLNVTRQLGMLDIHIENYLPQPASDEHTGATANMQAYAEVPAITTATHVVERYGGYATTSVQDGILHVNAVIPLP